MNEVYIMSATRSPVGAFGGSLKDFDPVDLGAIAVSYTHLTLPTISSV